MVNLLVNDVTISELPVKLHIKLESAGITIESIPTQVVRPMFLGGGEARVLTGDDFAEYLRLDNLNFKGFSKAAYQKSGHLPGGLWKVSVSVRHFYTNSVISNVGAATAWITSYKPPVLTAPKNNDIEPSNAALPLTFSWQASKHVGGTSAIMYRFEMWERRVEGVPAQTVAATIPPIYTMETAGLTATVQPAVLALEPGMKYCWRVTAYDPSGMVTIENKGESEVRTFQYLEKCPEVCGLTVDVKDDTGYASWEENRLHLGGYNFEFYDDEGTCHKTLWGSSTKTAGIGGEYGKTWHVRVQGICLSDVHSEWSEWVDFKIPDAFKPLKDENGNTLECGKEVPERVITNFTLRDKLQKGDTIENRRGTTKFVIHSATRNEDGSFRGLSYMLMRIWGVSFLGEFDHLNVNTDGVIIGKYAWRTVNMGPGVVTPEDIERRADETALAIAGATYNNTIKDTVTLCCGIKFESIRREGNRYYALRNDTLPVEITSAINGKNRTLIKDDNGHELVIDKDGNVMGVEEYKKCGGSKALLRENIKEKDSQVTRSGNVKFLSAGDYLFDTYDNYSGKTGYAERFPSIGEGDYKPAYACVESNTKLEIKAEPYANITFKNERGVPLICKDGILEVTARGDRDTTSIYAYDADNNIVGKVNVMSYDKVTRKICLVPVGNTEAPDATKIKQGLDEFFAKLMVDFEVTIAEPVTIQYAKGSVFTHGGSGVIGVYNTDQKAAISKLKERGVDEETAYLFLVEKSNALKDNDDKDYVSGYMPRGYQFGFIYHQVGDVRTIAHELCHGAFHLKHTFDATDYLAPENTTDNLMDYNHGEVLNHWQWKEVHQPKSVRFKWLQEEEEGEYYKTNPFDKWIKNVNSIACASQNNLTRVEIDDVWPELRGYIIYGDIGRVNLRIPEIAASKSDRVIDLSTQKTREITDSNDGHKSVEIVYNSASGKYRVFFEVPIEKSEKFIGILNGKENGLIESLITSIPKEESKEAYSKLSQLPICGYNKISISDRIKYLEWLSNELWTNTDQEEIILALLKHVDNREVLYTELYKRPTLLIMLMRSCDGDNRQIFIDEITKLCDENWEVDCKTKDDVYVGIVPNSYGTIYSGADFITHATLNGDNSCNVTNYIGRFPKGPLDWGLVQELKHLRQFVCNLLDPVAVHSSDGTEGVFPLIYCVNLSEQLGNEQVAQQFAATINYIGVASSLRILSTGSKLAKSIAFVDLTKTGLDCIFEDKLVIEELNKTEDGRKFLKYWQIVSVTVDVTTIGADILEGILEYGPKASKALRAIDKNEAANNVDELVAESKEILNESPDNLNGLGKRTDAPELSSKQKEEDIKSLDETSSKAAKLVDNLNGELRKTCYELSAFFDELKNKGVNVKYTGDGTAIRFFNGNNDIILEIANGKFTVKKWGAHYLGTVEKELDNGYWLVKNADGSYSIDLGFKEGRTFTGKEVNEYYIKTGRSAPYADDCVVTEELLKQNDVIYMVINKDAEVPGGWATNYIITEIEQLRQDLAVLEKWKNIKDIPTCAKYRVKQNLRVRNGKVGPQFDFPAAENGQGVIYFGGSQQYEIIQTRDMYWRDGGWKDFIKEVNRNVLK